MTKIVKNLYGLILAGGYSKRMGQDKALICFHGKPQVEFLHDLLLTCCEEVFIAIRDEQAAKDPYRKFPQIKDLASYRDSGPLGGILSAMTMYPERSWFVMACDLPFVNQQTIDFLIENRKQDQIVTAFKSVYDGLPEPLCAIWETTALDVAKNKFKQGITCPRKILIQSSVELVTPTNPYWLNNVNNCEELDTALRFINNTKKS